MIKKIFSTFSKVFPTFGIYPQLWDTFRLNSIRFGLNQGCGTDTDTGVGITGVNGTENSNTDTDTGLANTGQHRHRN